MSLTITREDATVTVTPTLTGSPTLTGDPALVAELTAATQDSDTPVGSLTSAALAIGADLVGDPAADDYEFTFDALDALGA